MSLKEWAKREVSLAIEKEKERGNDEDAFFGYARCCYAGALEVLEILCDQGHSGLSICITKDILDRLIDGKPLTPIEDTEDVWNFVYTHDGKTVYQCKRMSSLFKTVDEYGNVSYSDHRSCACIDIDTGYGCHNGFVQKIYYEKFPITMPYLPPTTPDKVYCTHLLTDRKHGDYDTLAIHYILKQDGTKVDINRYFKEGPLDWVEIDHSEYIRRLGSAAVRKAKEKTGENKNI